MLTRPIRAQLITLVASIALGAPEASATNWVGDGTSCRWATFADAIANSGGAPIYLVSGHVFIEGGITIARSQEIHVGDANCNPSSGSGVAHAVISGAGQTLDHLTITAGDVVFDRVDVVDHVAPSAYGGNIDVQGGTLTLRNAVISGGLAANGGGIHSRGTLRIHGNESRITGNSATGSGGGIKTYAVDVHVTDGATVSSNVAADGGGLTLDGGGTLYLADRAAIKGNTAVSPYGGIGGGAWLAGASLDTSACAACQISNNTASGDGGGVLMNAGAVADFFNMSVTGNTAGGGGGGAIIYNTGTGSVELALSGATFDDNAASGGNGGGLLVQGPGISSYSSVDTSTLANNHSSKDGGAIYLENAALDLLSVELATNTADGSGGGIAVEKGGSAWLYSVWDHANLASGSGGGIFLSGASNLECDASWIHANTASQDGGGIALYVQGTGRPTLTMNGAHCDSGPGGPLLANQYCSEVRDNVAGSKGGGLFMETGDGVVDSTAFLHNSASVAAQAIDLFSNKNPTLSLTNSLVAEHTASSNAVVVVGNGSTLDAEHVTITANSGAPVRYNGSALGYFRRSIVWDADAFMLDGSVAIDATCSSFGLTGGGTGVGGTGAVAGTNIVTSTDPRFVSSARGKYRLQFLSSSARSPEIDACSSGLATDLDGNARPVSKVFLTFTPYDRGAFERQ
jgi:fibronectin-binding autotransporter adhesin